MSESEKLPSKEVVNVDSVPIASDRGSPDNSLVSLRHADDALLAKLGYKSEFRREFSVSTTCRKVGEIYQRHLSARRDGRIRLLYNGRDCFCVFHILLSSSLR